MQGKIMPEGWHNWGNAGKEKTARYAEYQATGPAANSDVRVKWAKQLTGDEAKAYTVKNILGGADGWTPSVD